jgi:hypothetical protein
LIRPQLQRCRSHKGDLCKAQPYPCDSPRSDGRRALQKPKVQPRLFCKWREPADPNPQRTAASSARGPRSGGTPSR